MRALLPALAALLLLLSASGCATRSHPPAERGHAPGHGHGHEPHRESGTVEERIARYEAADRLAWQKPDDVVRALRLRPDAHVADLGAGSGYFALRLARAVPEGRVFALDIEPEFVRRLSGRARGERIANLETRLVSPDSAGLAPASVDLVLIVNTYHHLPERARYLAELRAALRPGGRIALVDFHPDSTKGPPKEHKLPKRRVLDEAQLAGLTLVREHTFLPEQYFLELGGR